MYFVFVLSQRMFLTVKFMLPGDNRIIWSKKGAWKKCLICMRLHLSKCSGNKVASWCVKLKVDIAILRFVQRLSFNPLVRLTQTWLKCWCESSLWCHLRLVNWKLEVCPIGLRTLDHRTEHIPLFSSCGFVPLWHPSQTVY